jgi:hypothetical protein
LIHTAGAGIDQLGDGRSTDSTTVMNAGIRFRSNRRDRGPLSGKFPEILESGIIHPPFSTTLRAANTGKFHGTRHETVSHTLRPVIPVLWPLSSAPFDLTGSLCSKDSTCTTRPPTVLNCILASLFLNPSTCLLYLHRSSRNFMLMT